MAGTVFSLHECRAFLARPPLVPDPLLRGLVGPRDRGPGPSCPVRTPPFPPFDRAAMLEANRGRSLNDLLGEFKATRADSLEQRFDEAELDRRGRHPEFGAVTLRQLLSTWTAHDLDHVQQIVRVLAKRLGDDAGPWKAYLRILEG